MSNNPPLAGIILKSGYPMFGSQDSSGTLVIPAAQYVWVPTSGTSGLYLPVPVDTSGNPQVSLAGSSITDSQSLPVHLTTNPEVSLMGSNTLFNGTYTVTGSAGVIGSSQSCTMVTVQNDPNSNGYVYVGSATAQTMALAPGASRDYFVSNVNLINAKFGSGTTSATLNWEAKS